MDIWVWLEGLIQEVIEPKITPIPSEDEESIEGLTLSLYLEDPHGGFWVDHNLSDLLDAFIEECSELYDEDQVRKNLISILEGEISRIKGG